MNIFLFISIRKFEIKYYYNYDINNQRLLFFIQVKGTFKSYIIEIIRHKMKSLK